MPLADPPRPSGDMQSVAQVVDYLIGYVRWFADFINHIDTLNVEELDATVINTGTLNAALVTIKSLLNAGAYIQIDGTGLTVNNGTKDTLKVDTNGNITSQDGVFTGGTIRTAASGSRVELSGNALSTYTASGARNGPSWGTGAGSGTVSFGDTFWYHEGVELLAIFDNATNYTIRPGAGTSNMIIGGSGKTVNANGTWSFSSGVTGTVYVSATSGGVANIPITFTTGLRTS